MKEDPVEVSEVKRLDDNYEIAVLCGRKILHVFSVYAPQQVGLMRKKGSLLRNYQIIYMMSLRKIFDCGR